MRRDLILQYLYQKNQTLLSQELEFEFSISNPTLRNELRDLNEIGKTSGFLIRKKRDSGGYFLDISDDTEFQAYLQGLDLGLAPDLPRVRVNNIMVLLLQMNDFQTVDALAENLMVGRSTILNDLKEVEEQAEDFNLVVERKSRYGIRIVGSEENFRRALSFFINQNETGLIKKVSYQKFEEEFADKHIRDVLITEINKRQIELSYFVFENILSHIKVLAYRVSQRNFILPNTRVEGEIILKPEFLGVSREVCETISKLYNVELPESEISYLAMHISGKSSVDDIDKEEKEKLKSKLYECLVKLDAAFLMKFSEDHMLLDMLALHMHPLFKRLCLNLTLSNPLIEDVYSRYSYLFIITFRFSRMVKEVWGYDLSRDEMGYVVMHFAGHMERAKREKLSTYKKILLLFDNGNSFANYTKTRLDSVFKDVEIELAPYTRLSSIEQYKYNLLVSSFALDKSEVEIPFLQISSIPTSDDVKRITKKIVNYSMDSERNDATLNSVFYPELFKIVSGSNYLEIIKKMSEAAVSNGFAYEDYPDLVMEREEAFTTIFQGGIAAPHPVEMRAIKDSISVTILKKPIEHKGRMVQLIFLINVSENTIYLVKELSNLITYLEDTPDKKQLLLKCADFYEFQYEVSKMLFR